MSPRKTMLTGDLAGFFAFRFTDFYPEADKYKDKKYRKKKISNAIPLTVQYHLVDRLTSFVELTVRYWAGHTVQLDTRDLSDAIKGLIKQSNRKAGYDGE